MCGALVPAGIASASISEDPFLLPAVFAMDWSEACTDFELHAFRLLLRAAPGACDHSGMVSGFFTGAVVFFSVGPVTNFLGKFSLPSD